MKKSAISLSLAATLAVSSYADGGVNNEVLAQLEALKAQIAALEAKLAENSSEIEKVDKKLERTNKKCY